MNKQQQQQPQASRPSKKGPKKPKNQPKPKVVRPDRFVEGLRSAPVAIQRVRRIAEPRFSRSYSNGDITVEHEEFIQDVVGAVPFTNIGIPVNPGLITTFPWLAQMAPLYESYLFEKLEFRFESTSATTATGSLMMAVDYDSSDALAPTKQSLAPYRRYVRSAPWEECQCISLREDLTKRATYYVRSGPLSANQDIKLYDVGLLNLAVSGQANTAPIGELYIRYRVKFMTPQLTVSGVGLSQSSHYSSAALTSPLSKVGNAPLNATGNASSFTLTSTAPYQGLIVLSVTGVSITDLLGGGSATSSTFTEFISGGTAAESMAFVNFSAPGQTYGWTITATSASAIDVRVGQYAFSNS